MEVPGVRRFLTSLPAGAWAVVTSCAPDLARLRLSAVGLPIPEVVVTSDDVSNGKPAPDGYRLGAQRLGVDPAACVVFEDAPPGIAAGLAAGARVVARVAGESDQGVETGGVTGSETGSGAYLSPTCSRSG